MIATVTRLLTAGIVFALVPACSLLPEPKQVISDKYLLEYEPDPVQPASEQQSVLLISLPRAHSGFDTRRIAYMKQDYGLRYYTRSSWADTPARMIAPLLAEAMNATGHFQALHTSPGALSAGLRLDSELIRFYQDFRQSPSELRVTLRARLVDLSDNQVIATELIDIREPADSEDAFGGVLAANRAVAELMVQLAGFCSRNTGN